MRRKFSKEYVTLNKKCKRVSENAVKKQQRNKYVSSMKLHNKVQVEEKQVFFLSKRKHRLYSFHKYSELLSGVSPIFFCLTVFIYNCKTFFSTLKLYFLVVQFFKVY
jgi:hypothetical protein